MTSALKGGWSFASEDNKYSSISCVIPITLFGVLSDISLLVSILFKVA